MGAPANRMGLNPLERNRILNFTEIFIDFVSQQIQHEACSCTFLGMAPVGSRGVQEGGRGEPLSKTNNKPDCNLSPPSQMRK